MTIEEHIIYAENLSVALNMTNTFSAETMESLDAAIKALKQKPCEDAISRQAVLKVVEREQNKGDALSEIEKLPSVNTQEPKQSNKWIPIKSRPLTDEEKQKYLNCELCYTDGLIMDINDGLDEISIFECDLPDLDEENVLVTTKFGYVCSTIFYRDIDYGCYFEGFEDEGDITAWMPLPEPMKAESEE